MRQYDHFDPVQNSLETHTHILPNFQTVTSFCHMDYALHSMQHTGFVLNFITTKKYSLQSER